MEGRSSSLQCKRDVRLYLCHDKEVTVASFEDPLRAAAPGSPDRRRPLRRWRIPRVGSGTYGVRVLKVVQRDVLRENVLEDRPLGIGESMEEALTCYERVRKTADHILPLNDPRLVEEYADGVVARTSA
jgi:hypothetical protein